MPKKYHSLSSRVFRIVLAASLAVGFLMLIVGVGAHTYYTGYTTIANAINLTRTVRDAVEVSLDPTVYGKKVMEIYKSMSPEERAKVGTKEYYSKFSEIEDEKGYIQLKVLLDSYIASDTADDIYYAVYDAETSALVYVADPAVEKGQVCPPGHWEKVKERELKKFQSISGPNSFAYDIGGANQYGFMSTCGVRVTGADGKPFGYILADNRLDTFISQIRWFVFFYTLMLILLIVVLSSYLLMHMRKTIVGPINSISDAAKAYADDKKSHDDTANHFDSLDINTGDEIEKLSQTMAEMEVNLNDYEKNIAKVTGEKERISTELGLAKKIQADTLPNEFPPFPDRTDINIFASTDPAKEVSGDFYDFYLVDDKHIAFEIADVSGKGIPAALFMMVTKVILQNEVIEGRSPGEALTNMNERICGSEHEGMFVTVWLGILDLETGKLKAANAGHEYPVIKQPDGDYEVFHDKHSFVIGGLSGIRYKEYELDLKPGAKVFLYTDGVTEAIDSKNNMYGMERMLEALNDSVDLGAEETVSSIKKSLTEFTGDEEQFDDVTMMCLEYKGMNKESKKEKEILVDVTLPAEIENQAVITEKVDVELEKLECPPRQQAQIDIAIDELFSNIAKYAYSPEKGDATVRMELEREPKKAVTITFIDSGTPYDPMSQEDPDITLSAEERGIGGLGILMVKKSMDELKYEYKDGQNIFMIKRIIED